VAIGQGDLVGAVRHLGRPKRSIDAVPTARSGAALMSESELARALVFAALADLIEEGLATTWHEQGADRVELRCSSGEIWLLDGVGVTRLR